MKLQELFRKKPKKIGLALSGGGAHGIAHVGVLQVLEREGIFPDYVAGTSAGAIIGAAYAAGIQSNDMEMIVKEAGWPNLLRIAWRNSLSLFDTEPMQEFIAARIGNKTFDELPRKFCAVACDIVHGKRVVLNQGSVAQAVRASAAYPGLFQPVEINGQLLIDGGVVDNLPADVVREMGADYVIGVNLMTPSLLKEYPANSIDLLVAVINLMQTRAAIPDLTLINCLIHPQVGNLSMWSFSNAEEMKALGRSAAEQMIVKLKKDLDIP